MSCNREDLAVDDAATNIDAVVLCPGEEGLAAATPRFKSALVRGGKTATSNPGRRVTFGGQKEILIAPRCVAASYPHYQQPAELCGTVLQSHFKLHGSGTESRSNREVMSRASEQQSLSCDTARRRRLRNVTATRWFISAVHIVTRVLQCSGCKCSPSKGMVEIVPVCSMGSQSTKF